MVALYSCSCVLRPSSVANMCVMRTLTPPCFHCFRVSLFVGRHVFRFPAPCRAAVSPFGSFSDSRSNREKQIALSRRGAHVAHAAPHFLPFYPTIVLDTGVKVTTVPDWLRKQAPVDAAAGKEYVGRLMGKVT